MNKTTYYYHDKPIFGFDIGYNTIKVMQIESSQDKAARVLGYGVAPFDPTAMKNGVIIEPEKLAESAQQLFRDNIIGTISTRRVAMCIPSARTFDRVIKLPKLNKQELMDAVRMEAEQYIPVPLEELYLDYDIIRQSAEETELLAVGVPKKIVDSYMDFAKILGLEPVAMETSTSAGTRIFLQTEQHDVPTVLIDFGSLSTDITIYDKTVIVTGTVAGGGDDFTNRIAKKLEVTLAEAHTIKTKYGLSVSKKQREITEALQPDLDKLFKEIRRMIRYYEERSGMTSKIKQIITMGGGANMPGLSENMTDNLRLAVRTLDPWHYLDYQKITPPIADERTLYVTVTGLALMKSQELFA